MSNFEFRIRRSWLWWHHIRIRAEEAFAVEVDHVVGVLGDPDFGFPGDVGEEGLHCAAGFEGGHEDEASLAAGEEVLEFLPALSVHRAGAGDGFDEQEPVSFGVMDDDIGNLGGGIQGDAERCHGSGMEVDTVSLGIADAENHRTGSPAVAENLNDGFDKHSPTTSWCAAVSTAARPEHGSHEVSHRFRREELTEFLLATSGVCCGRDVHFVMLASKASRYSLCLRAGL